MFGANFGDGNLHNIVSLSDAATHSSPLSAASPWATASYRLAAVTSTVCVTPSKGVMILCTEGVYALFLHAGPVSSIRQAQKSPKPLGPSGNGIWRSEWDDNERRITQESAPETRLASRIAQRTVDKMCSQ